MAGLVKTYNPKRVIVVFGGVPISGFADGSYITITPGSQRYTKAVGADGEVARGKSNDNTHEVTLTLIATSVSNNVLSSFVLVDKLSDAGALPLQIIDLSGTTLFFWPQAWVRQPADIDMAKEVGSRAWLLDTGQVTAEVVGGNIV